MGKRTWGLQGGGQRRQKKIGSNSLGLPPSKNKKVVKNGTGVSKGEKGAFSKEEFQKNGGEHAIR